MYNDIDSRYGTLVPTHGTSAGLGFSRTTRRYMQAARSLPFHVTKWKTSAAQRKKARNTSLQPTGKARILCVTVQRRERNPGLKTSIHVCKENDGEYKISKSFRLKSIKGLSCIHDASIGMAAVFVVTMVHRGFTGGEIALAFEAIDEDTRMEILGILYSFCRSHERRTPQIDGFTKDDLGMYGELGEDGAESEYTEEIDLAEQNVGHPILDSNGSTAISFNAEETKNSCYMEMTNTAHDNSLIQSPSKTQEPRKPRKLWSIRRDKAARRINHDDVASQNSIKKYPSKGLMPLYSEEDITELAEEPTTVEKQINEAQIGALFDIIAIEGKCLEDYRLGISNELFALQEASVHEILENSNYSNQVENEINSTMNIVDELEEGLGMLNTKIQLVQDNMSVIEQSNNRLEYSANENRKVVNSLEKLLSILSLSPEMVSTLKNPDFSSKNLQILIKAAWKLVKQLEMLQNENISVEAFSTASNSNVSRNLNATSRYETSAEDINIPIEMQNMRAVKEMLINIQDLVDSFCAKSSKFLNAELQQLGDKELATLASLTAVEKLEIPDHSRMNAKAEMLSPLIDVSIALNPNAESSFQGQYGRAVNVLLRKEVSAMCKELRRQVLESQPLPEHGLLSKKSDPVRTLERINSKSISSRGMSLNMNTFVNSNTNSSFAEKYGHGTKQAVSADQAFDLLASLIFPLFTQEAEIAQKVFKKSSITVSILHRDIFYGIEDQIVELIEVLSKAPRNASSLAMIGTSLHWQYRLCHATEAQVLLEMLKRFENVTKHIWYSFVQIQIDAIRKFDGKSSMIGKIRNVHVIPCVVNLEALVSKIESMVMDCRHRDNTISVSSRYCSNLEDIPETRKYLETDLELASSKNKTLHFPSPFASTISDLSQTAGSRSPQSPISCSTQEKIKSGDVVRNIADEFYDKALSACIQSIEAVAALDPKHSPRLRLENYSFLRACFQQLPTSHSKSLQHFRKKISHGRNDSMAEYLQQQIQSLKLDGIFALKDYIIASTHQTKGHDENSENYTSEDAPQRIDPPPISVEDAHDAVVAACQGLDKHIMTVHQRLQKHFSTSSPYLFDIVWDQLERQCVQNYEALLHLLPKWTGDDTLSTLVPSPSEITGYFAAASSAATVVSNTSP